MFEDSDLTDSEVQFELKKDCSFDKIENEPFQNCLQKLCSYNYLENATPTDIKVLVTVIIDHFGTLENAIANWTSDCGFTPTDTAYKLWSRTPFIPAEGQCFKPLSEFVSRSGGLIHDLILPEENLTLIHQISKKYCMVHSKKTNSTADFWDTLSRCWGLGDDTGNKLFLSALADLVTFHQFKANSFLNVLFQREQERDILVLTYLAKRLGVTVYAYNHLTATCCSLIYPDLMIDPDDVIQLKNETPYTPGTVLLTQYLHNDIEDDPKMPYIIIGQYREEVFPMLCHSESTKCDLLQLVTKLTYHSEGITVREVMVDENLSRMSSHSIANELRVRLKHFSGSFEEKICGRLVTVPYFFNIKFEQINVTHLSFKYRDTLDEFGVAVFRTNNFNSVRPLIIKNGRQRMSFNVQRLSGLVQYDGTYLVESTETVSLDIQKAIQSGHKDFGNMRPEDNFKDHIVTKVINSDKMYMRASSKRCPFISDWSTYTKKLVCDKTSPLQRIDKHSMNDVLSGYRYVVSAANSFEPIQTIFRGLFRVVYLLAGYQMWLIVPKSEHPRFMIWLEAILSYDNDVPCRNVLYHKALFLDPSIIPESFGVTFVVQEAGDLLIFDTNSIYWGWNIEFSVAFTYNFSSPEWISQQHIHPICDFSHKLCRPSMISVYDVMAIRSTDTKNYDSTFQEIKFNGPHNNYYKSDWHDLFPRLQSIYEFKNQEKSEVNSSDANT